MNDVGLAAGMEEMHRIDQRVRQVLSEHCPVDTSGGSHNDDNLIFCGVPHWHQEFEGWQAWIDHVAPFIHDAIGLRQDQQRVWPEDDGEPYSEGFWRSKGEKFYDERFE